MTNDPKLLSIIILVINLIVLGPVSWIIKDLKTDQQGLSTRINTVGKRLDSLQENTYTEYASTNDLQLVVKRLSVLENRIYELNNRIAGNAAGQ